MFASLTACKTKYILAIIWPHSRPKDNNNSCTDTSFTFRYMMMGGGGMGWVVAYISRDPIERYQTFQNM